MKNNILIALLLVIGLFSCTDDFDEINTPKNSITKGILDIDFKFITSYFPQMQKSIYYNFDNSNWKYQIAQNLYADVYSGYMGSSNPFKENANSMNYVNVDWNNWLFKLSYEGVMAPWSEVLKIASQDVKYKHFEAAATLLKVAGMHRVVDAYGPIPYLNYGKEENSSKYDSVEDIYKQFFKELDFVIDELSKFHTQFPNVQPLGKEFDKIFEGDYVKWMQWANTLRLRLAIRISNVNPTLAKAEAKKATENTHGLLTEEVKVIDDAMNHPLNVISHSWNDTRMGANMESILKGLKDPRMALYFSPSTYPGHEGEYIGIRYGIQMKAKSDRENYSNLGESFSLENQYKKPFRLMAAAEPFFLLAEAKLKGWTVNAANYPSTVDSLYTQGIEKSMSEEGVNNAAAKTYISNAVNKPSDYVDYADIENNIAAVSTVTVKWDNAATNEQKLEKIITQKWIASFPESMEAWSEFRRTGYPKLFPMKYNGSSEIDSKILIRRMNFPFDEYKNNQDEVTAAAKLLKGSVDNGAARLWWDTGSNLFN